MCFFFWGSPHHACDFSKQTHAVNHELALCISYGPGKRSLRMLSIGCFGFMGPGNVASPGPWHAESGAQNHSCKLKLGSFSLVLQEPCALLP